MAWCADGDQPVQAFMELLPQTLAQPDPSSFVYHWEFSVSLLLLLSSLVKYIFLYVLKL